MKIYLLLIAFILSIALTLPQSQLIFNKLADMPTARGAITSASDGNCFYVSNGFSVNEKFTGIIEKYDISKNSWSTFTTSVTPKQFPSSVIVDNKIYIFN